MNNHPYLYLIMQQPIIKKKPHVKHQPDWSKIFREKAKEVKKSHKLWINEA